MTKTRKQIEISVGIICSDDNQVFVTQRGENSHLAGLWEFPGGKVEPNETPYQTLYREIAEEVDIHIHSAEFLQTVHHSYEERDITIHAYLVEEWDGEPCAVEGQASRWIALNDLNADDFPTANRVLIEMLKNSDKKLK